MPGGPNPRDAKTDTGGCGAWAEPWPGTGGPSPPQQRSKRKGTHLPPCPPTMPARCARRVWPGGGRGLQGPLLSPGVLPTAAAPSFSELLLLGRRRPLPAAGTQASPAPVLEPAELETRHPPGDRGPGPAGRLRPSFRGAPREAAAPPRRSGPSSLPPGPTLARRSPPLLLGALGGGPARRWAGARPDLRVGDAASLHCPPAKSRGRGRSTAHPHLPRWLGRECV